MASSFTINVKVYNGNNTGVVAHFSSPTDNSVTNTLSLGASSSGTATITTTEYKGTINCYLSATGYDNSSSSSFSYEYNPLDDVKLSYNVGLNTSTGSYEALISLKNDSNYNLVFQPSSTGYLDGDALSLKSSSTVDFKRNQTITPFNLGECDANATVKINLIATWTLNGSTKTSSKTLTATIPN